MNNAIWWDSYITLSRSSLCCRESENTGVGFAHSTHRSSYCCAVLQNILTSHFHYGWLQSLGPVNRHNNQMARTCRCTLGLVRTCPAKHRCSSPGRVMSQYNAASSSPALEWQPHGVAYVRVNNVNVNVGEYDHGRDMITRHLQTNKHRE